MRRFCQQAADARDDYAGPRQAELFIALGCLCRIQRTAARSFVLCRQTLHFDTLPQPSTCAAIAHCSAKEFIDRSVLLEIKMFLQSTDLAGAGDRPTACIFPTSPIWGVI